MVEVGGNQEYCNHSAVERDSKGQTQRSPQWMENPLGVLEVREMAIEKDLVNLCLAQNHRVCLALLENFEGEIHQIPEENSLEEGMEAGIRKLNYSEERP